MAYFFGPLCTSGGTRCEDTFAVCLLERIWQERNRPEKEVSKQLAFGLWSPTPVYLHKCVCILRLVHWPEVAGYDSSLPSTSNMAAEHYFRRRCYSFGTASPYLLRYIACAQIFATKSGWPHVLQSWRRIGLDRIGSAKIDPCPTLMYNDAIRYTILISAMLEAHCIIDLQNCCLGNCPPVEKVELRATGVRIFRLSFLTSISTCVPPTWRFGFSDVTAPHDMRSGSSNSLHERLVWVSIELNCVHGSLDSV